jgi:rhamnose utilization protein RhaD (predicted bifunctional aldolase and dehydrogenase)/NAD(P)-dependent dehydrogenase (short-subunit alcohol dehydrogenase family)
LILKTNLGLKKKIILSNLVKEYWNIISRCKINKHYKQMREELKKLVEFSRYIGKDKDFVVSGGGNTSFKDNSHLWVKASGSKLAGIDKEGFVQLERSKLQDILNKTYPLDSIEKEIEVKKDLFRCAVYPEKRQHPSVETLLHEVMEQKYVVHLHPTVINGLLCAKESEKKVKELFGDEVLYLKYTDPGFASAKAVEQALRDFHSKMGNAPKAILLENHGVFVGGNDLDTVQSIYKEMADKLKSIINTLASDEKLDIDPKIAEIVPAVRMLLSDKELIKVASTRNSRIISRYYGSESDFRKVAIPFVPDTIIHCQSKFLYIQETGSAENILNSIKSQLERYQKEYHLSPKIILVKNLGCIALANNHGEASEILDVFEDQVKIGYYTEYFGGPRPMGMDQINFVSEIEKAKSKPPVDRANIVQDKIMVVTGGAQGFGAGIAEELFRKGANIIVADINDTTGPGFVEKLNHYSHNNRALFVKTDVSKAESVQHLIEETVKEFGGLDAFISNAGILRAGSLDEMTPETFDLMTKINYQAYFLCAKFASKIMKLQNEHKPDHFMDIIQINSKSGLKGSNKNFAYAGGKFGGVGLTQSFALELMPYKIKVNSICPGNFFDGPLWADPRNGLFVQYLNAGKVPGAKTIEDVKKFYEDQVPAKRGCNSEDVMKAIYYVIDQEYETGQAIPVTGGQIMLN